MKKQWIKKVLFLVIAIILITLLLINIFKIIVYPRKYKSIVEKAASNFNVDPNLIYAIIKQESKFNSNAISKSGAKGLMQIMDATAQDTVKKIDTINSKDYDIFDPYTNIFIGTKYISYLIEHFEGNYYLAIIAYNAGLGKVDSWLNMPYYKYTEYTMLLDLIEYSETKNYLTYVLNNYNNYVRLYK